MNQKLRIIIADDHAIVRRGIKQIILDGFTFPDVDEAEDAETLLSKLMREDYDLVILDISLPGRSGLEALKEIKQLKPQIPVLMLSINPVDQYGIRTMKQGASGYLMKDAAPAELLSAMKTILNGKKYLSHEMAQRLVNELKIEQKKEVHELLSDREFEVFKKLAEGIPITEIAAGMSLSVATISTYRSRILDKMHFKNNAEIIYYAIKKGII